MLARAPFASALTRSASVTARAAASGDHALPSNADSTSCSIMRCTAGAGNLRRRAGGGEMPGEFLSQHARKNRRGTPRTACRLARGGTTAAPQLPVPLPCRNRRTRTVRGAASVGAHTVNHPVFRLDPAPPRVRVRRVGLQACTHSTMCQHIWWCTLCHDARLATCARRRRQRRAAHVGSGCG